MKLGSPEPGKSLPSQPALEKHGDSKPDKRGTNADQPSMETAPKSGKLGDALIGHFNKGMSSGGRGQSVVDMVKGSGK